MEHAKARTRIGGRRAVEYCRFAEDLVVLIGPHPRQQWLRQAVETRLRQEFVRIQVTVNETKSRIVDLTRGESCGFLGCAFRRMRTRTGRWMPCRPHDPSSGRRCYASSRRFSDVIAPGRSRG